MSRISYLIDYFKFLKNPFSCLLFKLGFKNDVIVKIKYSNTDIYIDKIAILNLIMVTVRNFGFKNINNIINFINVCLTNEKIIEWTDAKIKILNPYYNIDESNFTPPAALLEYYGGDYFQKYDIDYNNREIIDIGANVGDSALYFASFNSKVCAFEPVKELYEESLENAKLNPNLDVNFYNYGVSDKKGTINITFLESASSYMADNSYEVEIITIEDILKNYDIKPDLLKMDCEGCEFGIIQNCDLSMFNEIIFEYHSKKTGKDYHPLIDKLKKDGFSIKIYSVFEWDVEDMGVIYAYK